jgi:hypothetical protein
MIAGLTGTLSTTLSSGLHQHGVSQSVAHHVGSLPPVASLFAALLGVNPIQHLLAPSGALSTLSAHSRNALTGHTFFPQLISGPFHQGLSVVFAFAAGLSLLAALASFLRGPRATDAAAAAPAQTAPEHEPRPEMSPTP